MTLTPGNYGGTNLDADQIGIANTIANVAHSMGASSRDLEVAYMAAMAESSMRNLNYGDRDSLGVFQQRPSQGWGTAAQVTDPTYATTKFFQALFGVPNRDSLSLAMEAQSVQRSGDPTGSNYAKWQATAASLVGGQPGGPVNSPDGSGGSVLGGIGTGLSGIATSLTGFAAMTAWLSKESSWVRIISGVFGSILVLMGAAMIAKEVHT